MTDTYRPVLPRPAKEYNELDQQNNRREIQRALDMKLGRNEFEEYLASGGGGGGGVVTQPSLGRNFLINGNMNNWNRGTTFGSVGGYGPDRWYCNRAGGTPGVTFSPAYGAFGTLKNWLSVWRNAGDTSVADGNIYQPMEWINTRRLAGKKATLSLLVGTGSTLSSTTDNLGLQVCYRIGPEDSGPNGSWLLLPQVRFSAPNASAPVSYSHTFDIPTNATQLMAVISFGFANTAGADDRYYVTEIQFEEGAIANSFEYRFAAYETWLCQRYYMVNTDLHGIWIDANGMRFLQPLPAPMRAQPTLYLANGPSGYHEYLNIIPYTGLASVALMRFNSNAIDFVAFSSVANDRVYGNPALLAAGFAVFDAELYGDPTVNLLPAEDA